MEPTDKSSIDRAKSHVVPDELMQEMHDANEQFHKSKQLVEQTMAESEYDHQEHVNRAAEQLREAERRVEEVNHKIHGTLKPPPAQ